jgi:hypothetical protein
MINITIFFKNIYQGVIIIVYYYQIRYKYSCKLQTLLRGGDLQSKKNESEK